MKIDPQNPIIEQISTHPLSPFQKKVYTALLEVEKGTVITYKQLAEKVGLKNGARAIGTAMAKNPFIITVPCHRVVKSNGDVGEYSAPGGRHQKIALLIEEGVSLKNGKVLFQK
jgi:methylated-DNA-[protein]-cysteine S-methyltransferase